MPRADVSITGRLICGLIGLIVLAADLLVVANAEQILAQPHYFGGFPGQLKTLILGAVILITFPLYFLYVAVFGRFPKLKWQWRADTTTPQRRTK